MLREFALAVPFRTLGMVGAREFGRNLRVRESLSMWFKIRNRFEVSILFPPAEALATSVLSHK
jgi:hypothetical protein